MTQDQKKVVRALVIFVCFKAVLYGGIAYAAKSARDARKGL